MSDQLNQICRTQEQFFGSQQYLDLLAEALEDLQTSDALGGNQVGISQSFSDVNPKIGIYATSNALLNSISVAGKFEFDIGVTGLMAGALGLRPNTPTFLSKEVSGHPDSNFFTPGPDVVIATAVYRSNFIFNILP